MNRQEFLAAFLSALGPLSPQEEEQIADYYEELICDGLEQGLSEEECLARFGTPAQAAAKFREDYFVEPRPAAALEPLQAANEVRVLDLSAEDLRIQIQPVREGSLQILFDPDPEQDLVESEQTGDTWRFRHKLRHKLRIFRGLFGPYRMGSKEITVLVPADFSGTLLIKTSNAKISAAGLARLEQIALTSCNAPLETTDLDASLVKLQTSNGSVQLCRVEAEEVEASTSNSSIRAQEVSAPVQKLRTSCGGVHLDQLSGNQLSAVSSNAGIHAKNCSFAEEFSLHTSNGKISMERAVSNCFSFQTSNGSITGTVYGDLRDFSTVGRTSNGSCNIPNISYPDQTKQLTAITSNGKIKLDFIND